MFDFPPFEMLVPLPMPVPDGLDHRLLLFCNEGPDFTGRDVLLMELLSPHIIEMHARQLRRQQDCEAEGSLIRSPPFGRGWGRARAGAPAG